MVKIIMMVLLSNKLVSVASVCVQRNASYYSRCSDLGVGSDVYLAIDQGIMENALVSKAYTKNFPLLKDCVQKCIHDTYCYYLDYNCQTGDCSIYYNDGFDGNVAFGENGHISGWWN
jgi:hypothetical protein